MKKHFGQAIITICLVGFFVAFIIMSRNGDVYKSCYVEAGVAVTAKDFLKDESKDIVFSDGRTSIDTGHPGEYPVQLESKYFTYNSVLYVRDTVAPVGQAVDVTLELGQTCEPNAFVENITDVTKVTVSYNKEPDFEMSGQQTVEVLLTDEGNNQTIVSAEMFVRAVQKEIEVEVGSNPPVIDDFVIECKSGSFITDVAGIDYSVPADKKVCLLVDGTEYEVIMHIVDTVPPVVETQDVEGYTNVIRTPEQFILSVEDATEVSYSFKTQPDFNKEGEQTVEVEVTDAGGNVICKTAKMTLIKDTEAPVITQVNDIYVVIGNPVSYKKNIVYTDNCEEGLECIVDNSLVNLDVAGTYPLTYLVRDCAGNEATASVNVIVSPKTYDENVVNALADEVLARIITPSMSPIEKVQAIFNYVKSHVAYINHSEKEGWVRAAYEGLADGKGDCYVYACTSKVLLTRAGIPNMDIEKIPAKTRHYWNLVDVGDGWYHFDTTPRKDRPTIFMWNEAQMMDYSQKHNLSHNYDHSLYPVVN